VRFGKFPIARLAALLLLAVVCARGALADDGEQQIDLSRAFGFNSITQYMPTPTGVLIETGTHDPHFSLPLEGRMRKKKLRIEFDQISEIYAVQVFFGFAGKGYRAEDGITLPAPRLQDLVLDVPLPKATYTSVRIDLEAHARGGHAHILSVKVLPMDFTDGPTITVLLTILAALLVLVPGLVVYVFVAGPRASTDGFAIFGFAASTLVGVAGWLVLWAAQRAGVASPGLVVLLAGLAAALALLVAVLRPRARRDLVRLVREMAPWLMVWFTLFAVCAYVVTRSTPLPVHNLYYNSVSGPKTFGAFRAHDNLFQYENARALADDIPLSEPYARGRLVFQPEDREILPGVTYAPVIAVGSYVQPVVGRSYLLYTLVGIAFNLMLMWPLASLLQRYYRGPVVLALLATLFTAFAVGNVFLTWFKLAGAALFLSGLLFVLRERPRMAHWLGAGGLIGLAANMHSSAALGLPLIFLWLAWRDWRSVRGAGSLPALAGPVLLAGTFVVLQLPWSLVKSAYFHDEQHLMKSFFLAGKSDPDGLLASVRLFFESVPLSEQFTWRATRLWETWQFHELGNLVKTLHEHGVRAFLLRWNVKEFGRTAILFYPLAVFAACAVLARRRWPTLRGWLEPVDGLARERRALVWMSFATLLALVVLSFGRIPPYVPAAEPMALLAIMYSLLAAGVYAAPRLVGTVFSVYVVFAVIRMAVFL